MASGGGGYNNNTATTATVTATTQSNATTRKDSTGKTQTNNRRIVYVQSRRELLAPQDPFYMRDSTLTRALTWMIGIPMTVLVWRSARRGWFWWRHAIDNMERSTNPVVRYYVAMQRRQEYLEPQVPFWRKVQDRIVEAMPPFARKWVGSKFMEYNLKHHPERLSLYERTWMSISHLGARLAYRLPIERRWYQLQRLKALIPWAGREGDTLPFIPTMAPMYGKPTSGVKIPLSSLTAFKGTMDHLEAASILGLTGRDKRNVNKIKEAHLTLLRKNHPDKGGSPFLTNKINEAKDILLERAESSSEKTKKKKKRSGNKRHLRGQLEIRDLDTMLVYRKTELGEELRTSYDVVRLLSWLTSRRQAQWEKEWLQQPESVLRRFETNKPSLRTSFNNYGDRLEYTLWHPFMRKAPEVLEAENKVKLTQWSYRVHDREQQLKKFKFWYMR